MVERYRGVVIVYPEGSAAEIKETIDDLIDQSETALILKSISSILVEEVSGAFSFKIFSAKG